jgi:hypothetical protein
MVATGHDRPLQNLNGETVVVLDSHASDRGFFAHEAMVVILKTAREGSEGNGMLSIRFLRVLRNLCALRAIF